MGGANASATARWIAAVSSAESGRDARVWVCSGTGWRVSYRRPVTEHSCMSVVWERNGA